MQRLSEKKTISGFPVSPDSVEPLVKRGWKTEYRVIAYFLSNICQKVIKTESRRPTLELQRNKIVTFLAHSVVRGVEGEKKRRAETGKGSKI